MFVVTKKTKVLKFKKRLNLARRQGRHGTEWRAGGQEQVAWLKTTETESELILKMSREVPFLKRLKTKKREVKDGVSNREQQKDMEAKTSKNDNVILVMLT